MAYENQISITITAEDEASAVIEGLQTQLEDFQAAVSESADKASESMTSATDTITNSLTEATDAVESATAGISTSLEEQQTAWEGLSSGIQEQTDSIVNNVNGMAQSMFTSLGSTAEDYQSNMEIIAEATQGAEGSITLLGTTAEETNSTIIASNQDVILSYQAVQAQIDKTDVNAASSAGLTEATSGAAGAVGMGGVAGIMSKAMSPEGIALIGGAVAVKMAADFQQQVTRLYTTAGETANQQQLEAGIQQIADLTGESVTSLTSGSANQPGATYVASSAGFNDLSGLQIVRSAAEAAKAEGADPGSVTNALTTAMNDYNAPPSQATNYMDMILQSVAQGKTTLAAESTALPTVLTTGATAGLSLPQVLGPLSTLTASGVSTDQAGQDLSAMTKELAGHFTAPETSALQQYGLNPTTVAQDFSKQGLTGTVDEIMSAMMKSKTPAGLIMQQTLQQSQVQQADLKQMLASNIPAAVKNLGEQLENGTISYADFRKESQALPEADQSYAKQIETVYNKANSFNSLLAGGQPGSQTVLTALGQVFGQSDVAQAAEILDQHKGAATADVKGVQNAGKQGGANIEEWPKVAGNLNTQLGGLWQTVQTVGRGIGTVMIPPLTDMAKYMTDALGPIANLLTGSNNLDKGMRIAFGDVIELIAGPFTGNFKDLERTFDNARQAADKVGSDIERFLVSHLGNALNAVGNFGQRAGTDVSHWFNDMAKDLTGFTTSLVNWAGQAVDNMVSAFTKIPGKVGSAITSTGSSFVHDIGHDLHIPGFALGTSYAPGGLALVGEQGPELVGLPQGSQVLNAAETRASITSGGAGRQVIIQQLNINNNVDAGMVVRQIGWSLANA